MKHKVKPELIQKLQAYFQKHESNQEVEPEKMNELIKLLPGNLRIELVRFRFKVLLEKFAFLKNRSNTFLLDYLEKLKPIHYEKGDLIMKIRSRP
jgi:hypothetical protein